MKRFQSHLRWLSVGGLNAHAAESEDTASTAAGRQQLLDDGFVLFLQRQHDCETFSVKHSVVSKHDFTFIFLFASSYWLYCCTVLEYFYTFQKWKKCTNC